MIDIDLFEKKWSFLKKKEIFIACSGGVDSMVLTHLIKRFASTITLLHVNYNLRGEESIRDELFVKEYAEKNKLLFEVKSVNTKFILEKEKGNLQESARKIRYEWFEGKLNYENSVLLLAHHQDDQIETFYQNLARKSGISGLSCMLEVQSQKVRPLLNFSKKEIYTYATKNMLEWREDSTNQSNKYTRNRLRNEFLPFLQEKIPGLNESVLTLIRVFQENRLEIEKSIEKIVEDIHKNAFLELVIWQKLNDEQQFMLLKAFGFNSGQLSEINKLLKAQKGKSIASFTYTIIRENDVFAFVKKTGENPIPKLEIKLVPTLPETFSKDILYLDAEKISGELKLTYWQIGDRISPLGMKGSKLISDIITEAKIPNAQRETVLVLRDDKHIHWCPGLKVARIALATEKTKNILQLTIF